MQTPALDETTQPFIPQRAPRSAEGASASSNTASDQDDVDEFWDEDDEDDDENFEEPFSLLENVVDGSLELGRQFPGQRRVAEVIHYRDGCVIDVLGADADGSIRVGFARTLLLAPGLSGPELYLQPGDRGEALLDGKRCSLGELLGGNALELLDGGTRRALPLGLRDYAQVRRGADGYLLRFVYPPPPTGKGGPRRFERSSLAYIAGSTVLHWLALVGVALAMPNQALVVDESAAEPRFARVAHPQLERKAPAPKVQPPQEQPRIPTPKLRPTARTKRAPTRRRSVARHASMRPGQTQRRAAGKILLALAQTGSALPRSNLASLSNLAAVRTPAGSGAGFRVAAAIGRTPGIKLGGGGSGTPLITGRPGGKGKVALRALRGTGRHGPRGGFRAAPVRPRSPGVKGCLSRAAIMSVVVKGIGGVQACYERALATGHQGGGKVIFDWTISTSGSVSDVRQHRSTLRSASAVRCIMRRIRGWHFPRPGCGGAVQVRFPFVFQEQSFR